FVIFAILGFFTVAVRLTSSWRVGRLVIGALGQEAGLTLIITLAVGRWLYGSFRRFFEQPRRAAALSTAACTVVFWWLFYEWYQTVAVLGTFVLWSP
ncbi:MAG TPA: hypothetical protein VEA99_21635, partial [Gemmatimonadaceae bacterium]|nr:hypothetical protein [Gemmatimonadaceae bacterium]